MRHSTPQRRTRVRARIYTFAASLRRVFSTMRYFRRFPRDIFRSSCLTILLTLTLSYAPAALADQQSAQELLTQADEVLKQMSQITGLPIKGIFNKQVVGRPEIQRYLAQNVHEEMTPAQLHAEEAVVRALGLVPRDFSLEKFIVKFYTEQAAGYYDPKRKTMFIADWTPANTQGMVLSHELTHALQDQSWDLERYLHGAGDDDDAAAARQAVVEGYATAAMLQQATGGLDLGQLPSIAPLIEAVIPQQFGDFPEFAEAPAYFRTEALFPYLQGIAFIQAGLQRGGWKDLNVLFEHPPGTTREIFDPQTYFDHQVSSKVSLPRPPALENAAGFKFLSENSMGELGYYALLGQLLSEEEAKTLGPGWLGDRYVLYEKPGVNDFTLVARTVWTSDEQAQAFSRDYHTILTNKYSGLTSSPRSSPDEFIGSAANGGVLLLRKGNQCVWAEGVPAAKTETMLAWLRAL